MAVTNVMNSFYAKSLSKYDFNLQCVNKFISKMKAFYEGTKDNFNAENYATELIKNAPIVIIRMQFEDAKTVYEQSLLKDWLSGDEKLQFFEIEYKYYLKDSKKMNRLISDLESEGLLENCHADFQLTSRGSDSPHRLHTDEPCSFKSYHEKKTFERRI